MSADDIRVPLLFSFASWGPSLGGLTGSRIGNHDISRWDRSTVDNPPRYVYQLFMSSVQGLLFEAHLARGCPLQTGADAATLDMRTLWLW